MVTANVELELRLQLKEAGRLLANPPAAIDELLHILDQSEKLLSLVDQSPNNIMQEALGPLMKALFNESFLEHSNMDVKVSIASCLCEIIRITAPDPPYSDEEMKRIFQCVVSSFENLSDKSSRSYAKRASILETVSKVRACVIMLDLECDDLIVKMYKHFLNSVRDHHIGNTFSLMVNIMALVLEESEDISLDLLKPLLASVKKNSEGVLPVARKLGEEVIKKSANILRPYLNKAVAFLGDSLVDYSQVLTSICEGTTDFVEHNDESASVQPKVVDTAPTTVSLNDAAQVVDTAPTTVSLNDAAQVINNGETITTNDDVDDHPDFNLTSKLDTNDSVAIDSGNVESNLDETTKSAKPVVSETFDGENRAEKSSEFAVSVQKPLQSEVADAPSESGSQQKESQFKIHITKRARSKKKWSSQTDQPSTVAVSNKVNEVLSDPELRSPKRARKKTPKAEGNTPSATTGSDVEAPSTVAVSNKVNEVLSDPELRSPKRARKKTPKAEGNTPSATTGSDVEAQKSKKVEAGDSRPKQAKRSRKKVGDGGSAAKKPKLSGKKMSELNSKQDDTKVAEAGDSDVKSAKQSLKKSKETDSDNKPLKQSGKKGQKSKVITKPSEDNANKDEETESDNIQLKLSGKKEQKSKVTKPSEDNANKDEETESDNIQLKPSGKKEQKSKVKTKPGEDDANNEEADPDATPVKQSAKKAQKRKVVTKLSEDNIDKDDETDFGAKPLKQSGKKVRKTKSITKPSEDNASKDSEANSDATPLKQSVKKGQKSKVITKPSEDNADKDEETDSDAIPLKQSVKKGQKRKVITKPSEDNTDKDEETDSDVTPLIQSVKKGQKSKVTTEPSEDNANKDEEADSEDKQLELAESKDEQNDVGPKPLNLSENKDDEETDSDNIPLMQSAKRLNKSGSSLVKSSSKNKDVMKQGRGKNVKKKDQTKPLSEDDDGMDVSLKSALKKAIKGKGNLEEVLSTGSKRKRSNTKTKVTKAVKYDESLVGRKVKVWWPHDKMYYEGVVESFDPEEMMHKVAYLDGDEEILELKKEKWEILEEFSTPNQEVAAKVQKADILPEAAGSSEGEGKVKPKEVVESKENEETKKYDKKDKGKKIVYSRGKKGSKSKAKSSDDYVKESTDGDVAEKPESEKEKSTETPEIGSKTGNKKKKMN